MDKIVHYIFHIRGFITALGFIDMQLFAVLGLNISSNFLTHLSQSLVTLDPIFGIECGGVGF